MKTKKWTVLDLSQIAIVCALYVALTLLMAPLSYGNVQFRFAEALILLCFYRKKYGISLILGCFIANCFSPLGWVDMVFGTLSTVIPVLFIIKTKHLFLATLWPTIFVGLIVGAELCIVYELPFWITLLEVIFGEFVCVTLIGYPLFKGLEKNETFMKLIGGKRQEVSNRFSSITWIQVAIFAVLLVVFFALPISETGALYQHIRDFWPVLFIFALPIASIILHFTKWRIASFMMDWCNYFVRFAWIYLFAQHIEMIKMDALVVYAVLLLLFSMFGICSFFMNDRNHGMSLQKAVNQL